MPVERSVLCPVLIGRTNSLELATRLLDQARHEHPQTLIISGEAGSGKSRLVAEIAARSWPLGYQVLRGHCFEADRSLPYAPLLDLLRAFCLSHSPAEIAQAIGPLAPELVKLIPELATLMPELRPSPQLEAAAEKLRLFQALAQFIASQAGSRPLLIVIEDLHWSDEASLEFLYHFARRPSRHSWLLVLTCRSEAEPASLKEFLAKIEHDRLAEEAVLAPLSRAEVGAMLQAIFRLEQPVRPDFLDAIHSLTEGNPFFVEEVLKSLLVAGDIYYAGGRWDRKPVNELRIPRTVQVAVQQRTDRLSPSARQLLNAAAVAGRRFDFSLLQLVMLRLDPGLSERVLVELVKELVAAQLVAEVDADHFTFRHALTQQAVLGDMLARERRPLHRLVAVALEQLYAAPLGPHLASLADHFYEAGDWTKAADYAQRAGEHAQALYTPRAAIEYFTRAVEAADHLTVKPAADLYLARGAAYELTGAFDAARADLERALGLARAAQDRRVEWTALLSLGFLWAARDQQRAGGYLQKALEQARSLDDPATLARSLNRVGNWHLNMEQPFEALRLHREALALFESLNDRRGVAETLDLMGTTTISLTDLVQGRGHYQRAVAILRDLDDQPAIASCLTMLALCAPQYLANTAVWPAVRPDEPEQAGEEALRLLTEMGWRSGEALAHINLGLCLTFLGQYQRGLAAMISGLEISQEVEHHYWQTLAHLALGATYLDLVELAAGEAHLQQALAMAQMSGSLYWMRTAAGFLALVYLAQGRSAPARDLLDSTLPPTTAMNTMGERQAWAARAELWLAGSAVGEALALADQLISAAPNSSVDRPNAIPRLAGVRGRALMRLGRLDEAEAALMGAYNVAQAAGAVPMEWRLRGELGRLYQFWRRREQAEAELRAAESLLDALAQQVPDEPVPPATRSLIHEASAGPPSMRASFLERALAQLPARPALSQRQSAKQEFGGLTRREREVAAMVARGKSNRAMAAALVVSERTIEKHVENVLSKLAFTSRAQIAAWAVEKGLSRQPGG